LREDLGEVGDEPCGVAVAEGVGEMGWWEGFE